MKQLSSVLADSFRVAMFDSRCARTRSTGLLLVALLSSFFTGCQKKGAVDPKSADDQKAASAEVSSPDQDLTPLEPVAAPEEVVVRIRVNNPGALADGALDATSLPFDWRKLALMDESAAAYLSALDSEGTIESAVVLNLRNPAKPHAFFSVGARGINEVLKFLDGEKIESLEAPGGIHLFPWERLSCGVGRAIFGSPARVVCSHDDDTLRRMLPYALRGLPGHKMSEADVHIELDLRPIRSHYGKELSRARLLASVFARQAHVGHAKYDAAVSDAVSGTVEELAALLQDTDLVTAKLFEEKGSFRAQFSTIFSGKRSTTVQSILSLKDEQGAAPALFDFLPATAATAVYSRQLSSETAQPWMNVLSDLVSGRAEHEGASPEFSMRLQRVVRTMGPQGGSNVLARGPLTQSLRDGKEVLGSSWTLLGTERKKADVELMLDDIAWIVASKDLRKILPKSENVPTFRRAKKKLPGVPAASVFEWELPPEATNKLSADLEGELGDEFDRLSVEGAMKALSGGTLAAHEVKGFTWLSWGEASEVAESFRILENSDTQRLGGLGSVGGVRTEPSVSAGFAKLDGLLATLAWLSPPKLATKWTSLVRATPHRGQVPLLFFSRVQEGERVEAVSEVYVPAEMTRDLATLVVMIAAELGLDDKN